MATKPKCVNKFKGLNPGDPVEVIWRDATTLAKWTSVEESAKLDLCIILTRGTLVAVRDDAVVVALDSGIQPDGSMSDHHGVGVMERSSVVEIHKLRRAKKA